VEPETDPLSMLKLYLFFIPHLSRLRAKACADLAGGVPESFFFSPIVFGASLVAEASHVVERLIAVPACALRFQGRHTL
jgi:hypothetical protein